MYVCIPQSVLSCMTSDFSVCQTEDQVPPGGGIISFQERPDWWVSSMFMNSWCTTEVPGQLIFISTCSGLCPHMQRGLWLCYGKGNHVVRCCIPSEVYHSTCSWYIHFYCHNMKLIVYSHATTAVLGYICISLSLCSTMLACPCIHLHCNGTLL